jgi:hypothetical protein
MLALEEKEGFGDQCTEAIWPFPATAEKVMRGTARMRTAAFDSDSQSSHLRETLNFGSNPGGVRTRCCSSRMSFSEYRIDFGGILEINVTLSVWVASPQTADSLNTMLAKAVVPG